jgi:hypothetical protein
MLRNPVLVIALLTGLALLPPRTGRAGPPDESPAQTPPPAAAAQPRAAPPAVRPHAQRPAARAAAKSEPGVQLPVFEPGMWEYRRTMTVTKRGIPQNASVKKCSDPSKDIREKLNELQQRGCKFAPTTHSGERYHLQWECAAQGGPITMSDVLTTKGADSYEDVLESRYGQRVTRSVIVATRISACPPLPTAVPHSSKH